MIKKGFLFFLAILPLHAAQAQDIPNLKYSGPYPVSVPYMVDATDVNGKAFDAASLLDTPLDVSRVFGQGSDAGAAVKASGSYALHLLGFTVENDRTIKAKLSVDGPKRSKIFLDGKPFAGDSLNLHPGTHRIAVKYVTEPGESVSPSLSIGADKDGLSFPEGGKRLYTIQDVLLGKRYSGAAPSPDGKWLLTSYTTTYPGGRTERSATLTDLRTGERRPVENGLRWMNTSSRYYKFEGGKMVITDPATGATETLEGIPTEGRPQLAPNDKFLIISTMQEGPKERDDVYEIINPDDRQPGWRNRSGIASYNLETGVYQQLTFGHHSAYPSDVSADGSKLLFMVSRWQKERPTTVSDVYLMDLSTLETEKLVDGDGFLGGGTFSPDGSKILFQGSPECLGGVGKNVRKGQIPSMTDQQLYLMDIASRKVTPLTKKFDPCVQRVEWSRADGMIYFTAEDKDCIHLFRLDPKNGRFTLLPVPEEVIEGFSVSAAAPILACGGQGTRNSDRIYTLDLAGDKAVLQEDLSAEILKDVELGDCITWNFTSSRGDKIYGRYYLPPHFDKNRKYPLIVNYYGGCSPTSRNFETRYPQHLYAAMGYVVYVINPSGATGFGQEFSARHVNTAGEGVAEDIIEGTRKFVAEHPFVDGSKIGCIGASYGGFMTQYLLTKTDLFTTGISHAGISDHTSYWGEGYWGYSYSETSMAGSYPWTDKHLYVEQSPLFNADKIHAPLLFLHGSADTNVPIGESIQMYTALKLLGRPTAFVVVDGQNHHILQYEKRLRWQDTIFAWFQKHLRGDDSWWEEMYPSKELE